MKKRIGAAILVLLLVVGVIAGIKFLQIRRMIEHGKKATEPPTTVNTAEVKKDSWEQTVPSVGSLEGVQGVDITAELPGRVVKVAFESGERVEQGDLLVKLNTSSEEAQLQAAEAAAELARISFKRASELVKEKAIARSQYDSAEARLKEALAQRDQIQATIDKKTIQAPFAGRLGIRLVNIGQILGEGDPIVTLQSLDPIYVNFLLPQAELTLVDNGTAIRVSSEILPEGETTGTITAINPKVDPDTRNVRIQGTISNPAEKLRPGMFVNVAVVQPEEREVLTIPATAVLYAPYSNSVFVVEEKEDDAGKKNTKVLRQQFVRLGDRRGDFVAVLSGLKEGEEVVSSGVFKLRNGMAVLVDNSVKPEFKLNPKPENR